MISKRQIDSIDSVVQDLRESVGDILSESGLNDKERVAALSGFMIILQKEMLDYFKCKL